MALKFRRGTTAQQSGSLAFGEPYVNTTLGTLQIGGPTGDITLSSTGTGSTGNFGAISGSGLDITGNANIGGNLTLGGQLTIGDNTSDTVNVVASLSSSLIPQTDNVFDLGSATKSWRDLYISTGSIKMVANGAVVSTLSTNEDGSQNFPNGVSITSSLALTGSIILKNADTTTTIKNLNGGGFAMSATGSNASKGTFYIGYLDGAIKSNSPVAINGPAVNVGGYTTALTINGPSSGTVGGGVWLNRTGNGNIPWGILSDGSDNLFFGRGDAFTDNQIKFNYKGLNANILFSGSGIIPAEAYTYDLGTEEKPWRDLYISTGSINIVNNGSVISTLSTNGDGSQTFPNGLYSQANIQIGDGSYLNAGKFQVGRRGTSPDQNVVLGIDIMPFLTSGVGNVGLGRASLYRLTTGQSNVGVGDGAGYGISGSNSQNIAIGYGTAFFMTGSNVSQNVFLGHNAGSYLNNGIYNTAVGGNALLGTLNGSNTPTKSTALGYGAGAYLSGNSTNNLLLGANAGPSSDTVESYKFYVSNGDYESQPYMNGSMANGSRTLSINAATTISGSVTGTSFNGTINANNGVLSGSLQAQLPAGVVSGSSQVTLSSTTGGGTSDNVRFGSLGIGMAASGTAGRIDASGDVVAFSTSDKNFKENITPIENAIEKIRMISGNTYDWKSDMKEFHGFEGNDVGVIAQEIEAVLPQLVTTRETGYKAVKYDKLVALLIEGIKEQQQNIDNLTIQVEELKKAKGL